MTRETPPSAVPLGAPQGGDVRDRWSWAEPAVWTDRMLTALEQGVKGGKWFRLFDKVFAPANLSVSYQMAAQGLQMVRYADDLVILCQSQTVQTQRSRTGTRSSTLAQCLLCQARVVRTGSSL